MALEQITTEMDVEIPGKGKKKPSKLDSMKKKVNVDDADDRFPDWKFKNSRNGYISKGEIEEMPGRVFVSRGPKQQYAGKEEPEAKKPLISGSSAFKKVDLKK